MGATEFRIVDFEEVLGKLEYMHASGYIGPDTTEKYKFNPIFKQLLGKGYLEPISRHGISGYKLTEKGTNFVEGIMQKRYTILGNALNTLLNDTNIATQVLPQQNTG